MQAGQHRPCTQRKRKARIGLSQVNTGSSIAGKRRKKTLLPAKKDCVMTKSTLFLIRLCHRQVSARRLLCWEWKEYPLWQRHRLHA